MVGITKLFSSRVAYSYYSWPTGSPTIAHTDKKSLTLINRRCLFVVNLNVTVLFRQTTNRVLNCSLRSQKHYYTYPICVFKR